MGWDYIKDKFTEYVKTIETNEMLRQEIKQSRRLELNSFPGLLIS